MSKVKNGLGNLKDSLVLMDKKKLLIIGVIVVVIVALVLVLTLKSKTIKCEQTNDINGITNKNTVEITYKGDKVKAVITTFDYKASGDNADKNIEQIKQSMSNLGKVYDGITGVTFEETKTKGNTYQIVQTVDFKKISDSDLANIGIERSYKTAKSNYEAAGFSCK